MGIFDTSMSLTSSKGASGGGNVESAGHGPSGTAGGCSVLEALTALFLRGGAGGEAIASESRLGGSEVGGGGATPI